MKRGIRPSVQTNVPFIVYTATRGRKIKTKTKTKTKNRVNWPRTRTATMVRKFRWCLPPVVRLFWVCVCCTPDLSFYYLHGYDMRVREWCESQWGHAGAGHGWSPGGAYRYCLAASLVLSQCEASASDRALCDSVWTPVLPETETRRETGPAKPIWVWLRCEAPRTSSSRRRAHLLHRVPPPP